MVFRPPIDKEFVFVRREISVLDLVKFDEVKFLREKTTAEATPDAFGLDWVLPPSTHPQIHTRHFARIAVTTHHGPSWDPLSAPSVPLKLLLPPPPPLRLLLLWLVLRGRMLPRPVYECKATPHFLVPPSVYFVKKSRRG